MYKVSLEGTVKGMLSDGEIAKKLRQHNFVDNFYFYNDNYNRKIYIRLMQGEKRNIEKWIEELSISDIYGIYLTDAHWNKVRKGLFR